MKNAWAQKQPLLAVTAVVVVVGGGVFGTRQLIGEGSSDGLAAPPVTFGLQSERTMILPHGAVSLPAVEYIVEVPKGTKSDIDAWLVGDKGERFDLYATEAAIPSARSFVRLGYHDAPANPRIVVETDGRRVLEKPVKPLLSPMRAIPLVVALQDDLVVRETTQAERARLAKRKGFPVAVEVPPSTQRTAFVIDQTAWAAEPAGDFQQGDKSKSPRYLRLLDPDHGGLAQVRKQSVLVSELKKDASFPVEVFKKDGEPWIRVAKPWTVTFPGGGAMEVRPQERRLGREVTFAVQERTTDGVSLTYRSSGRGGGMQPAFNRLELGARGTQMEALGLSRLRFGAHEIVAKGKANGTAKPGPVRIDLTVTNKLITDLCDIEYVRIRR